MAQFSYVSTGLSSGIGEIARNHLDNDHKDYHHVMLCRNPDKFDRATNTTFIKCDFNSNASVKQAVTEIKSLAKLGKIPPVKVILNNAGSMYTNRTTKSVDGFEATFAVNVIAPYILISGLLPLLKQHNDARVFITGSSGHFGPGWVPGPYWDDEDLNQVLLPVANAGDEDPNSTTAGIRAYSTSKLAIIYVAHVLAKKNPDIKFLVYHPGTIFGTGIFREASSLLNIVFSALNPLMRLLGANNTSSEAGAWIAQYTFDDSLWAKVNNVEYCDRGKILRSSDESYNEKRAETLMKVLSEL